MAQLVLETIIIDQEGDAIITLTKPGTPFAIWEPMIKEPNRHDALNTNGDTKGKEKESINELESFDEPVSRRIKSKKDRMRERKNQRRLASMNEPTPEASAAAAEDLSNVTISDYGDVPADHEGSIQQEVDTEQNRDEELGHIQSEPELAAGSEPTSDPELIADLEPTADLDLTADPEPAVVYRVSSKHLTMASGTFRDELRGTWSESKKWEDSLYHLTAEDWDPEAFTTLLNILHSRSRQVPRSLTLETLAKIAVYVDYYRCWEAVEVWTGIWIQEVKKKEPIPASYCRNLMLWMLIAWVFELAGEFKTATKIALRHSQTPVVHHMDLPIPSVVLEAMELRRYEAIEAIISHCHDCIEKLRDTHECPQNFSWSYPCGSILLGALTKEMHRLGYLSPRPDIPFTGHSLENICRNLKEMKSPQWYESRDRYGYSASHGCSLQDTLVPHIDEVMAKIQGMLLHDFKDRAKEP